MLKLLEAGADGFLSYDKLVIPLAKVHMQQLVGVNGVGKTNLVTVLTEALYGKNIRGYTKGELFNRNNGATVFTIWVKFQDYLGDIYVAKTVRKKTTADVTLTKNGQDITSHTSKGTFENIAKIIGLDYDLFIQYIYQSSKFSTEFLTATPAARKEFLSSMLKLDEINIEIEKITAYNKDIVRRADQLEASIATGKASLANYKIIDLPEGTTKEQCEETKKEIQNSLASANTFLNESSILQARKAKVESEVSIQRRKLNDLIEPTAPKMQHITEVNFDEKEYLRVQKELSIRLADREKLSTKLQINLRAEKAARSKHLPDACDKCGHPIDNSKAIEIRDIELAKLNIEASELQKEIEEINATIKGLELENNIHAGNKLTYENNKKIKANFTQAVEIHKQTMMSISAHKNSLIELISRLDAELLEFPNTSAIGIAQAREAVIKHKAHLDILDKNIQAFITHETVMKLRKPIEQRLAKEEIEYLNIKDEVSTCKILIDSMKLVLSKTIESGIKMLEKKTNYYLRKFNSEYFIRFASEDSKVKVSVMNDGNEVNYYTLSTGQAARVSIATLFAMRDILNAANNNGVNLLILDEVVGTLDTEGKEQLIEILEELRDNNILLVSHDWTHPLLNTVEVRKNDVGNTVYDFGV